VLAYALSAVTPRLQKASTCHNAFVPDMEILSRKSYQSLGELTTLEEGVLRFVK
jgi:hypothetical protein